MLLLSLPREAAACDLWAECGWQYGLPTLDALKLSQIPTVVRILEAHRLLVGKPEGKRPLGRPRCRWIDNIKKDLLEIGLSVVDWIGLAQNRYRWRALVNAVMNLRVP
jgi:hypothetical protein